MRKVFLFLIIIYLIVIYYFSSIPVPEPLKNRSDVLLHFLEYGGLGILFFFYYSDFFGKKIEFHVLLFILSFILLYAVSDEFHQSFVPGRVCSVKDVIVDFVGALFFVLVLNLRAKKE